MKRLLVLLTVLVGLLQTRVALAQSELDLDADDRADAKKASKAKSLSDVVVREIERGVYLKTDVGTTIYLGSRSRLLRAGTTFNFVIGQDVVDKPGLSVAWELSLYQAIHNSTFADPADQVGAVNPNSYIQGDVHMLAGMLGAEVSGYPVRRLGIGAQFGGGVGYAPLLLGKGPNGEYLADVERDLGAPLSVHKRVLPVAYAGPTIEYYTKLSHFSLGIDADFIYFIGFDFGVTASAYLKYTF